METNNKSVIEEGAEEKKKKKIAPQIEETNKAEEPVAEYGELYTYGDYLKFKFDYMVELIRGKIFKMSPAPTSFHQIVVGNFHLEIGNYLRKKSCQVFIAPFDVVLPVRNPKRKNASDTVVQPDLCVICDKSKIDEAGCWGAPDWIIEILSPHTSKKDLQLKYDVYEEVGVKEYWIAMPNEKVVEVFVLENNKYKRVQSYTLEDTVQSITLPELSIELAEIFDYD